MTNTYLYLKTTTPQQMATALAAISGFAQRSNLPHERLHFSHDGAITTTETELFKGGKDIIKTKLSYTVKNILVQGDFSPSEITPMPALGFTQVGTYKDGNADPNVYLKIKAEKAAWEDTTGQVKFDVITEKDKPPKDVDPEEPKIVRVK